MSSIFSRQSLVWNPSDYETPVTIYGAGFIWSSLLLNLIKTGFKNYIVIDPDNVGEENLLNQIYEKKYVNTPKATCLSQILKTELDLIDGELLGLNDILQNNLEATVQEKSIQIIATDNIESRLFYVTYILENWDILNLKDTIFVFINTSGDVIYTGINKGDKEFFKTMKRKLSKLTNENTDEGLCGEKSAFYLGSLTSGYVVSELRKIITVNNRSNEEKTYTSEMLYDIKNNVFHSDFVWFGPKKEKTLK